MTTLIDNTFNQESWGASIRAYKDQKSILPYTQEAPHHETTYAHSRDERENKVDPLLQVFRNPNKEANLRKWEDTHNIHGLNKSFDLQLTRESQFDVVNNRSKKEGLTGVGGDMAPKERPNLSLQSGVHYNILSNHNHEDHALPDDHRDELERAYTPQKAHKRFGIAPKWTEKDHDMISNKYYYGHDQWEHAQRSGALDKASAKFFARNDKNPVTGKFYDQAKEEDIAGAEEDAKLTHGVHQMDIFPPRIKYGPGMAFDLATHTVKDGELFQLLREKDEEKRRGAYRAVEKRELEEQYKGDRDAEAFMKDGRRYMRIEPQRFTVTNERGYDVVTNEPLQGRDCKVTFPHRLPNKSHFWNSLGPSQGEHDARQSAKVMRAYEDEARGNSAPASGPAEVEQVDQGPYQPPGSASARSDRSYGSNRSGASMGRRSNRSNLSQSMPRPANVPPVPLHALGGPQGGGGGGALPPKTHSSWRSSSSMSRRSGRSSVRSSGFGEMQGF